MKFTIYEIVLLQKMVEAKLIANITLCNQTEGLRVNDIFCRERERLTKLTEKLQLAKPHEDVEEEP